MGQRLELQALLVGILGSNHVYFQPPTNVEIQRPCIVYQRDHINIDHADNKPYNKKKRYQITVIDADPDSEIPDKISELPTVIFDRHYVSDDLNHDVYRIFF